MERLLAFALGEELYAIDLLRVIQVVHRDELTRVPGTPAFLSGLAKIGEVTLPVVDLSLKFGVRSPSSPPRGHTILVVESRIAGLPPFMGLAVDGVRQVLEVEAGGIEPPPEMGTGIHVDFLFGLARVDGGLALVLNLDLVLSAGEVEAIQGLSEKGAGEGVFAPPGDAGEAPRWAEAETPAARAAHLTFRSKGRELGIPLPRVREILGKSHLTRIPGATAPIRGLMNVRGMAVPVLDLALSAGEAAESGECVSVVLLEAVHAGASLIVGVCADSVADIVELEEEDLKAAPSFGIPFAQGQVQGVGRIGQHFVPLLDVDSLLQSAVGAP